MDYIKLGTRYYRDPALQAANDRTRGQAEVLFLRGLALCGADETEGYVARSSLVFLGVKAAEKVAAVLVEEKLWQPHRDGWRYRSWEKWQSEHDALARRRKADRDRKAEQRRREKEQEAAGLPPEPPDDDNPSRDVPTDESRDSSRDFRALEERERRTEQKQVGSGATDPNAHEHAAALAALRTALEAVQLVVRWDKLTPDQVERAAQLVALHGVPRLVATAQRAWQRDNPPAFAQAWLGAWNDLPPARRLRAVEAPCPEHALPAPCISCAADRKAAQ